MSYPFNTRPTFGNNSIHSNNVWGGNPSSAALPLYKDKPLRPKKGSLDSSIGVRNWKGLIKMLLKSSILLFGIYVIYYLGQSIHSDSHTDNSNLWLKRRNEVRQAFLDSWHDYETNGWGYDVYHPVSQKGENMGPKPLGWIIVDSLDTMMIMGLDDEVARAREWVKDELTYDFNYEVNVFETTIRMLGGFLSAFYLSEDDIYLDKAVDLGNRLIKGFESRTGIPYASINLLSGAGVKSHADGGASSTAEVATLQLEFKYLAKLTGETLYWEKVEKIIEQLDKNQPKDGLLPIFVHPDTGKYQGKLIRLGSRGDSYYEYLLKQYLQTKEPVYRDMYEEAVEGIKKHMVRKSKPNGYTYIGELLNGVNGPLDPKMDHLVCFMGGLLLLGATEGLTINDARRDSNHWSTKQEANFLLGKELTHTCYKMYHDVEKTGLAPEIVIFNQDPKSINDFHIKPLDRHNLQRPETVESLYYLYKITKNPMYRSWGYEIFQNFVEHTKVKGAGGNVRYTSLDDVTSGKQRDNMESFWLAETLKYLYLLFDDEDKFDLSKVVFNTEAHVFPDFDLEPLFKTGWNRLSGDRRGDDVGEEQVEEVVKEEVVKPHLKPKIHAEKSFNENDKKKNSINQDDKVVMNHQVGHGGAGGAANGDAAKAKDAQVPQDQKPSKPIDEEVKELQAAKNKANIVAQEPVKEDGKIFKNKDEINEKLEELIKGDD